jgi:general stress protein YciG
MPLKRQTAANGKCQAATKAGRQCAAPAVRGGIYCALHNDPGRAAQLGRKGGANNRKVYEGDQREIPPPQNARDVKNFLAEAMAEIRSGKMDPKLGTTLGYLGASLLKAIETSDFEERLEKLENGLKNPSQEARAEGN